MSEDYLLTFLLLKDLLAEDAAEVFSAHIFGALDRGEFVVAFVLFFLVVCAGCRNETDRWEERTFRVILEETIRLSKIGITMVFEDGADF